MAPDPVVPGQQLSYGEHAYRKRLTKPPSAGAFQDSRMKSKVPIAPVLAVLNKSALNKSARQSGQSAVLDRFRRNAAGRYPASNRGARGRVPGNAVSGPPHEARPATAAVSTGGEQVLRVAKEELDVGRLTTERWHRIRIYIVQRPVETPFTCAMRGLSLNIVLFPGPHRDRFRRNATGHH